MDAYKKSRTKSIVCWIIAFALAIFYLIVSFLPFIFMVLNSFKEKFEMLTKGFSNCRKALILLIIRKSLQEDLEDIF